MMQTKNNWKENQYSLWKEFLPLSLSDVVMALTDPFITTALAHLPSSQINIGALGVAKSIAVFFESPIIMILHASNVLAQNKKSRTVLWRFTLILSGLLSFCLVLMTLPWFFYEIARVILGVEGELAEHTQRLLSILVLWPFIIGWRRFFQGLLIQAGYAKQVGKASLGRLGIIFFVLLFGFLQSWSGEILAASALISGILLEALLVTFFANKNKLMETFEVKKEKEHLPQSFAAIWKFYWPLASSSMIVWGARALLIVIIVRSVDGTIALAAWTAGWGIVLVTANATRMVQQVIIRRRNTIVFLELFIFTCSVGGLCSLILMIIGFSPIGKMILDPLLGNDQQLIERVIPVLAICSAIPLGLALLNAIQGILISDGQTRFINWGTWFGAVLLIGLSSILVFQGYPGAVAAAIGIVFALFSELLFLGALKKFFTEMASK